VYAAAVLVPVDPESNFALSGVGSSITANGLALIEVNASIRRRATLTSASR
jgi:hypothetical protein